MMRILAAWPEDPGDIDADWVAAGLGVSAAQLTSVRVRTIGEERARLGRLVRVDLDWAEGADGPPALVVKLPAGNPEERAAVAAAGAYEREARFYVELAPDAGVRTPECYAVSVDRGERTACLVLEWVEAPAPPADGAPASAVARLLRHIAGVHARWWRSADLATAGWLDRPGPLDIQAELIRGVVPVLRARLGGVLSPQLLSRLEQSPERLATPPPATAARTLNHGDLALDNFGRALDGRVVLFDWQFARFDTPAWDVAHLVTVGLASKDFPKAVRPLLDGYVEALRGFGIQEYSVPELMEDYVRICLRGMATPFSFFGLDGMTRGDPARSARWIGRSIALLRDLPVERILKDALEG